MYTDRKTTIADLKNAVRTFNVERNWLKHHTPYNIAKSIVIEAAELLELFQWSDIDDTTIRSNKKILSKINEEAADIFIYLLCMADSVGIDLAAAVNEKLIENAKKYPVH